MSKSNYVSLYGNLIKDAVIKTNDKGNEYALFTLSVPQDGTKWCDYINCIAFGDTAAIVKDNPDQNTPFHVEGRIHTGSYQKNGRKYYTTDIVTEKIELVSEDE